MVSREGGVGRWQVGPDSPRSFLVAVHVADYIVVKSL